MLICMQVLCVYSVGFIRCGTGHGFRDLGVVFNLSAGVGGRLRQQQTAKDKSCGGESRSACNVSMTPYMSPKVKDGRRRTGIMTF